MAMNQECKTHNVRITKEKIEVMAMGGKVYLKYSNRRNKYKTSIKVQIQYLGSTFTKDDKMEEINIQCS